MRTNPMPNVLLRIYRWYDNFLTLSKSNIQKLRKKRAEWQARNENINCNNWKTLRAGIFAVDLCKTTTVWWAHARKINKWSTKPCAGNWLLALSFLTQIVLGVERSQITLNALITPTTNSVWQSCWIYMRSTQVAKDCVAVRSIWGTPHLLFCWKPLG